MNIHKALNYSWLPITGVLLAAITMLSLTPLSELPKYPGSDKAHHLISYAALMLPAFWVVYKKRWHLMLLFFIWGGGIELIQPHVNRYGEWADFVANSLGLVLGAAIGLLLSRFYLDNNETSREIGDNSDI